ncbi:hypothetical protein Tco_0669802 [Tanacetum coccineum]
MLEILKKYGMETCDLVETLMEIKDKLDLDKNGTLVDATKYPSMIGSLTYLTSSRPHIVHATCLCARYPTKPAKKHLKEIKRIFCYLRGTVNMGLWYTKDSGFELTGFSDADYAGCKDTFKSTSGGTQFLGEKLVSWSSKKQDCMSLLTVEVECVLSSDELGRLVGKLASASVFYGRCAAFEEVAKMKDPFDLSKVKGYRSSYKKEHTKAENDLATNTFPFISEFIVDPFAPIEELPPKTIVSSTSSYNKESCSYTFEGFNL